MLRRTVVPALALALAPAAGSAHPHVFVDSRIEVVLEADRVLAVRLTWTYDEFFTLMLTEDLGLDGDGDGRLDAAETAILAANVLDWPPDFGGDLVVRQDGEAVPLAPRIDHRVAIEEGRMVEVHTRPLATPVPADLPVLIENFDPYYFVDYAILPDVTLSGGAGCVAEVVEADPVEAQARVDEIWEGLDIAGAGRDVRLPPVGNFFSDRVEIRCGG
jgi:ABC-type uncharacterized transport system substrate-binding protein